MASKNIPLQTKFQAVQDDLNTVLLERETEVHLGLLAILSRRHMFMLGEPGVAKSMLVDEIVARIKEARKFKWLFTGQTVPEEIFGAVDLKSLREGVYRRNLEDKLARVEFAMLDEVFNAGDSILNGLLMIINEGVYLNPGDDPKVPLMTVWAASNHLPQTAELEALVDRLVIKIVVNPLRDDASFVEMLKAERQEPKAFITLEEIAQAQNEVDAVTIGDGVFEDLLKIREHLREKSIKVSDRRFRQIMSVIKAEAWINGRNFVSASDLEPTIHCLWREPSQLPAIREVVFDTSNPVERQVLALRDEMEKAFAEFQETVADTDNPNRIGKAAMETVKYYRKCKQEYARLMKEAKTHGLPTRSLAELKRRLQEMAPELMVNGLTIPENEVDDFEASLETRDDD